MKRNLFNYILVFLAVSLIVACRSSKSVQSGSGARSVAELIEKNQTAQEGLQAVSAKMNVALQADGKDLTVGGTLRMKRDEVIQISLSAFFIEVARLEITPDYILVIDRMGKQYVRSTYREQEFLKRNGMDFNTLQALFWGRLFKPGCGENVTERDFMLQPGAASDEMILQAEHAGQILLRFALGQTDGLIRRVEVSDNQGQLPFNLDWNYQNYKFWDKAALPGQMTLNLAGAGKSVSLTLALTSVKQDDTWPSHTEVSTKYKQVSVDSLLKRLLKL